MVTDFKELRIYQRSFRAAMQIFELSKQWPPEEKYALTDQIRRSSRSVCANIGEAWFKRQYPKHFVSELTDASSEAAETIVWLDFASQCNYLPQEIAGSLEQDFRGTIGGLTKMIAQPDSWCGPSQQVQESLMDYDPDA
mgnify:CR=1 FL=1